MGAILQDGGLLSVLILRFFFSQAFFQTSSSSSASEIAVLASSRLVSEGPAHTTTLLSLPQLGLHTGRFAKFRAYWPELLEAMTLIALGLSS